MAQVRVGVDDGTGMFSFSTRSVLKKTISENLIGDAIFFGGYYCNCGYIWGLSLCVFSLREGLQFGLELASIAAGVAGNAH